MTPDNHYYVALSLYTVNNCHEGMCTVENGQRLVSGKAVPTGQAEHRI